MRKFEEFLRKYFWLLKPGIFLLLVLWAAQLYSPITEAIHNKPELFRRKTVSAERSRERGIELARMLDARIEKVKTMSVSYGPMEYFADLLCLQAEEKKSETPPFYMSDVLQLQQIMIKNIDKKYFSWDDFEKARQWYREQDPTEGGLLSGKREEFSRKDFFRWAVSFYFRSLLLVVALFLVRMSQRKGILETILASKWRFLLSVFAWPIFIGKYPFNIAREIRVEAEIRRMGDFLRRFKPEEKELAREVAASDWYQEWISGFRAEHRLDFRRSLLLTLIPAILLYFFLPVQEVSAVKARGDPTIAAAASSDYVFAKGEAKIKSSDHRSTTRGEVILPEKEEILKNFFGWLEMSAINLIRETPPRDLEHIPLYGYLAIGNLFPKTI